MQTKLISHSCEHKLLISFSLLFVNYTFRWTKIAGGKCRWVGGWGLVGWSVGHIRSQFLGENPRIVGVLPVRSSSPRFLPCVYQSFQEKPWRNNYKNQYRNGNGRELTNVWMLKKSIHSNLNYISMKGIL